VTTEGVKILVKDKTSGLWINLRPMYWVSKDFWHDPNQYLVAVQLAMVYVVSS
jgi:hypothetical protein